MSWKWNKSDAEGGISLIPNPKISDTFLHATHLTLSGHQKSYCSNLPSLRIPNLQSLQILPWNRGKYPFGACIPFDEPPSCCPLLAYLYPRPRSLELGGTYTGIQGTPHGLWTTATSSFPPPWLNYIILNIGLGYGHREDDPEGGLWSSLPDTVKRLSIVLPGKEVDEELWKRREEIDAWRGSKFGWDMIALAVSGNTKNIEIVGVERLGERWKGYSMEKLEEKAKGVLVECLVLKTDISKFEAGKRVEGIVSTTFEDYKLR